MKKIDTEVAQKFATAAHVMMTRVFSTELSANPRRLMIACGPAQTGAKRAAPNPELKFDVLGLGFRPGKEWKGPAEIFVEETRDGELRSWANCRLYASTGSGPIYVLTGDPDVCFSYNGNSLILLAGCPEDNEAGELRAKELLRRVARNVPDDIEQHRMM